MGFGNKRAQNLRLRTPVNPVKMRPRAETDADAKTDCGKSAKGQAKRQATQNGIVLPK